MTKNKRFINDIDDGQLIDTKGELSTIDYSDTVDFYELWEFLNKLADENNQLKSICKDHRDHAIDFKADCVRLEKENEELKKENDELQKELKALRKKYNDFSDTVDKRLKELKEND